VGAAALLAGCSDPFAKPDGSAPLAASPDTTVPVTAPTPTADATKNTNAGAPASDAVPEGQETEAQRHAREAIDRHLFTVAQLRDESRSLEARYNQWANERDQTAATARSAAEKRLTDATTYLVTATTAAERATGAMSHADATLAAKNDAVAVAMSNKNSPHLAYAELTVYHLERLAKLDTLVAEQTAAMARVEIASSDYNDALEQWTAAQEAYDEGTKNRGDGDRLLSELEAARRRATLAAAKITEARDGVAAASNALVDWGARSVVWADASVPTAPEGRDAEGREISAAAENHAKSLRSYLAMSVAERQKILNDIEGAEGEESIADRKSKEADKMESAAKKTYRAAVAAYEQKADNVAAQEQANGAGGGRVAPDYAGLATAKQARDSAKKAMDAAANAAKIARTAKNQARKTRLGHVDALKAFDKKADNERKKLLTSAAMLTTSIDPWANALREADAQLAGAQAEFEVASKNFAAAKEEAAVTADALKRAKEEVATAEAVVASLPEPVVDAKAGGVARLAKSLQEAVANGVPSAFCQNFNLTPLDLPSWPESAAAKELLGRVHAALKALEQARKK